MHVNTLAGRGQSSRSIDPSPRTPFSDITVERIRIAGPTLVFLRHLLIRPQEEFYGAEVIARTGLDPGTLYPLLKRLERAGWLTSRLEDDVAWMNRATPGRGPGKRRTFYTLAPEGHRAARHEAQHRTRGLKKPTDRPDKTPAGSLYSTPKCQVTLPPDDN
ncbi:hypothetical protein [Streptomyces sp.]|uniref:PadR family transcriptional regulator n=1 Tax=Streptomyces sp. TaxID=1931 RepID=UPI002F941E50